MQLMADRWLALDKLQHFAGCAALTGCFYCILAREPAWRRCRLQLAWVPAAVAAGLKELGDAREVRAACQL